MKLRSVLALGLWLVAGTGLPTSAQLPLQHGPAAPLCDAPPAVAGTPAEHAIVATVTRVDPGQGRLEFTTETGAFVLTTSAVIADLRVGDHVLLCLHEEGSDGKESFAEQARAAEDGPAATPRTP
jgi:hypothetical protein